MSHGLVAGSTQYPSSKFSKGPISLFHKSLPSVMVSNAEDEAKYCAQGYTEQYQPNEYPRTIPLPDGTEVSVRNEDEEADVLQAIEASQQGSA